MREVIRAAERRFVAARSWLQRVMPRAAIISTVVVVAWLLARDYFFARHGAVGLFFTAGFALAYFTTFYYGLFGARWLARHLLWRVRRRLVITYLFVGLTPVVLLVLLGVLAGVIGLNQVMTHVIKVHLTAQENQLAASARALAAELARMPRGTDDKARQTWLDERIALMQATLPGARVAIWRATTMPREGGEPPLEESQGAQLASEPKGEGERGVGEDTTPIGAPLPVWLRGRAEWHGLAFASPSAGAGNPFGSPSLRALVRVRGEDGRRLALLFVVPFSRTFISQLRENTGLTVHPFFIGAEGAEVKFKRSVFGTSYISVGEPGTIRLDIGRDQLGEPVGTGSLVVLPATEWARGVESQRLAFMPEFSAWGIARQLFEESVAVRVWQGLFTSVAVVFLVLELLALASAALMTRAVTGTVHRLYRATEFIKRGDFSHRVRVRSRDQLGELAEAFNEMSADIESLLAERVERERLEREVEIAAEVQAQLFPREVPRLVAAEVVGECRAARGVAGDYYDYVEITPGLIALALGDVSGKGISAALVMSNLQAALRAQATILSERLKLADRVAVTTALAGGEENFEMPCGVTGRDTDCAVESMAASINAQLCRSTDSNRFATVFLALYDDAARRLRYTNAGHNLPLVVRASGAVERLEVGGTVLGAFDWARYEEASIPLAPGDLLLLFSDGITEAQNGAGEEYGEQRLAEFAQVNRTLTADELRRALFREVERWTGGRERDDDQTIVILKAKNEGDPHRPPL